MIFPSYIFIFVFLPIVLVVWYSGFPFYFRLSILMIASYIFYGWWDYRFVSLLLATTVVDYFCGGAIAKTREPRRRKLYLAISIVFNLTLLGFFKYYDFFIGSVNATLSNLGMHANLPLLGLILPLGISFYTFKSISYSYDIYRGDAEPAPDIMHFAAFIALFPELVAGPIVRYGALASQLKHLSTNRVTLNQFTNGVWIFVLGLSKKLLIADRVAPLADRLFDGTGPMQAGAAWCGSLAYTIQLYFDFSAYSDMAVGLGLMLGFRFPLNFLSPYKAASIADFWNRWHITLSHFMRDYLFIPLGGSRGRLRKVVRNLFVTMFLGGLWHGAAWTFVVWGLYQGALLAVNALWRQASRWRLPHLLAVAVTFFAVHMGWVLFRAPNFERAAAIYRGLFGLNGVEPLFEMGVISQTFGALPRLVDIAGGTESAFLMLVALTLVFCAPNAESLPRRFGVATGVAFGLLAMLCIGSLGKDTPFIYFQF